MGQSQSTNTTIKNAVHAVQKSFNQSLMSIKQVCRAEGEAVNSLIVNAKGNDAIMSKCLDSYTPKECKELVAETYVEDMKMLTSVGVSSECKIDQEMVAEIQEKMKLDLESQARQQNDEFGAALNNLIGAFNFGGKSEKNTRVENSTDLISEVVNEMKLEVMQEALAKGRAVNEAVINTEGSAFVKVRGITMDAQASVFLSALQNNKLLSKAVADLDAEVKQQAEQKNRGLTDIVDKVMETVSKIASGPALIIAIVLICALAVLCSSLLIGTGSGGSGEGGRLRN